MDQRPFRVATSWICGVALASKAWDWPCLGWLSLWLKMLHRAFGSAGLFHLLRYRTLHVMGGLRFCELAHQKLYGKAGFIMISYTCSSWSVFPLLRKPGNRCYVWDLGYTSEMWICFLTACSASGKKTVQRLLKAIKGFRVLIYMIYFILVYSMF